MSHAVALIHGGVYDESVSLPVHPRRHAIAWDMITHYALTTTADEAHYCIVDPLAAPTLQLSELMPLLLACHDSEYINYVKRRSSTGIVDVRHRPPVKRPRESDGHDSSPTLATPTPAVDRDLLLEPEDAEYGLTQECHPYRGMFETAIRTVQGTSCAVRSLTMHSPSLSCAATNPSDSGSAEACNVWCALHWWGGRHHAQYDRAAGFCIFNDVVVGVQQLQQRLRAQTPNSDTPRVLVLDIDAHHGDGTQEAFLHDSSVWTCSLHRYGVGAFPGTGHSSEQGAGFGQGMCANIPLKEGATGAAVLPVVFSELKRIWASCQPHGVVVVCGADALVGDPLGGLNFDVGDVQSIVRWVMEHCWCERECHPVPLVILGAGGYVDTSFAKVAAAVTKDAVHWSHAAPRGLRWGDVPLLISNLSALPQLTPVPDTCEYFSLYAPSFAMGGLPPAMCSKLLTDGVYSGEVIRPCGDSGSDESADEHVDDNESAELKNWDHEGEE